MSKTKKYLQLYNHMENDEVEEKLLKILKLMFPDLVVLDYGIDDYSDFPNAKVINGKSSWIPSKQFIAAKMAFSALYTQHIPEDELEEDLPTYESAKNSKAYQQSKPHRSKYFKLKEAK